MRLHSSEKSSRISTAERNAIVVVFLKINRGLWHFIGVNISPIAASVGRERETEEIIMNSKGKVSASVVRCLQVEKNSNLFPFQWKNEEILKIVNAFVTV